MNHRKDIQDKDLLTTHDVAGLISVDTGTVVHWVEQGKLRAHRTPGGHRRIRKEDLVLFLRGYDMPVPDDLAVTHRTTALVVDDDDLFRATAAELLREAIPGVHVVQEPDGAQAQATLLALKPALLVLDIFLGGADGVQVCRDARNETRLSETRILAVTGNMDPAVKKRVMEAGADALLHKPLQLEKLKDTLSLLLGPAQRHMEAPASVHRSIP